MANRYCIELSNDAIASYEVIDEGNELVFKPILADGEKTYLLKNDNAWETFWHWLEENLSAFENLDICVLYPQNNSQQGEALIQQGFQEIANRMFTVDDTPSAWKRRDVEQYFMDSNNGGGRRRRIVSVDENESLIRLSTDETLCLHILGSKESILEDDYSYQKPIPNVDADSLATKPIVNDGNEAGESAKETESTESDSPKSPLATGKDMQRFLCKTTQHYTK
jgi:hypothetical protein